MQHTLRQIVPYEEFDYQILLESLKDYRKPRDKITQLLAKKEIIRVKKGLYVFGQQWRRSPVSLEVLANLIYGPSYLSREFALSYYGFIPERVHVVTSMTKGKTKRFATPVGDFSYAHLPAYIYALGVDFRLLDDSRGCLFASLEKALADTLYLAPLLQTQSQVLAHLSENMRIERSDLKKIDKQHFIDIATVYRSKNVKLLAEGLFKL